MLVQWTLLCYFICQISVTFDPFLYLALPLPPSKSRFTVTVYFDGVDESVELPGTRKGAVKVSLWLDPNQRVKQLKEELKRVCAGRFRNSDSVIELVQVRDSLIRRWLVDAAPLSSLQNVNHSDVLLAFETAPSDVSLVHIAVIQVRRDRSVCLVYLHLICFLVEHVYSASADAAGSTHSLHRLQERK